MATGYVILTPPEGQEGPFQSILTTGGEPVAFQVPLKWAERIVIALKLLDAHERDHQKTKDLGELPTIHREEE